MAIPSVPQASGGRRHHAPGGGSGELAEVRAQLREARETIEAIRKGGVDSLVIGPPGREQVYAITDADRPYRLIVESMNEAAATVSPRGVILAVNPRLCSMTGRPAADLVGSDVLDLVPGTHRPGVTRLLDVKPRQSVRGEAEVAGPAGSAVPVLLAVSGFDLDGMFLRCLILTDLTEQRAAENRIIAAYQALREQSALMDQVQASVGLGWWIADPSPDGHIAVSPQVYGILGISQGEFDGRTTTFWGLTHPDDAPMISAAITAALTRGAPFRAEHRVVRPDGSVRWVMHGAVVERDEAGTATLMLGICQDITDRKHIQEEIRAAAAEQRRLNDARFLAEYGSRLDERGLAHLRRIQAVSDRIVVLADSLLRQPLSGRAT